MDAIKSFARTVAGVFVDIFAPVGETMSTTHIRGTSVVAIFFAAVAIPVLLGVIHNCQMSFIETGGGREGWRFGKWFRNFIDAMSQLLAAFVHWALLPFTLSLTNVRRTDREVTGSGRRQGWLNVWAVSATAQTARKAARKDPRPPVQAQGEGNNYAPILLFIAMGYVGGLYLGRWGTGMSRDTVHAIVAAFAIWLTCAMLAGIVSAARGRDFRNYRTLEVPVMAAEA